jgi:hypothetical protein
MIIMDAYPIIYGKQKGKAVLVLKLAKDHAMMMYRGVEA